MTAQVRTRGLEEALKTNAKALRGGGKRTGALSTAWDLSGNGKLKCLEPVPSTNKYSQPLDDWVVGHAPGRPNQYIDLAAFFWVSDKDLIQNHYLTS